MNEDDARDWLATHFSTEALSRLEQFVTMLRDEADRQSLIARSTFDTIWSRHIADSAQLVPLAQAAGKWLDIGSGGGLPGIVVAILRADPIIMVEPRRKRVDFLEASITALALRNARVVLGKAQTVAETFAIVSARAVAPVSDVFTWTTANVSRETRYLLPRGRSWALELEIAQHAWHGAFHVEHSLTDPESGIVIADAVTPR